MLSPLVCTRAIPPSRAELQQSVQESGSEQPEPDRTKEFRFERFERV
jgi:hypothetical protein